jgi:hypothetical protein
MEPAGPMSTRTGYIRAGDTVQVLSEEELLRTLDDSGCRNGLPLMPEMLRYCGMTFRVWSRADKTCDTITSSGLRQLDNTVHLAGLRCDGSGHGGCQAECLIYWSEDWLKLVPLRLPDGRSHSTARAGASQVDQSSRARKTIVDASVQQGKDGDRFVCQATQLFDFSAALPWWDVRQYIRDVRSRNIGIIELVKGLARWFYAMKVRYPVQGGPGLALADPLNVEPGDLVSIKTKQEIEATLDRNRRHRGLSFDAEMVRYCGGKYRVRKRVDRIINERTGKMMRLEKDCIVLDDVWCMSDYHRGCPRRVYPYWREVWLKKHE